jgi:uncharacterized phosphatase
MKLFLIRHGETVANVQGLNQGQVGGKLTRKGVEQSHLLGLRLKKEHFDRIFASDLSRVLETAHEILPYHKDVPVVYDKRIREQNVGDLEGTPHGSISGMATNLGYDRITFVPKSGESVADLRGRVRNFLDELKKKYSKDSILIITHGGVIIAAILYYLHLPESDYKKYLPDNASITTLTIGKKNTLVKFNDVDHLKKLLSK